jgi:dynein heavy chain
MGYGIDSAYATVLTLLLLLSLHFRIQIFDMIEQEKTHLAVEMLKTTINVCNAFQSTYQEYKATASVECPSNPWRVQNTALFMRLDAFIERCRDVLELLQTVVQFTHLARVEVGGTKGKTLTTSIEQIFEDFNLCVEDFKKVEYDIMDVSAAEFDTDFYKFRSKIKELERRLGSVLTQSFEDCENNLINIFKLLDSFDVLLHRPLIRDELENHYISLLQQYESELKIVQENFAQNHDSPVIPSNLPEVIGSVFWCRGLSERIKLPMVKLQELDEAFTEREESKVVCEMYASILENVSKFENAKIEDWARTVDDISEDKLKMPLLRRDEETRHLSVNFDPMLVKMLREVHYFLLLDIDCPKSALDIYKKMKIFRQQTCNLDLIVDMYNEMLNKLLPVESPLLKNHFDQIDKIVLRGIKDQQQGSQKIRAMDWTHTGINSFIKEAMEQVTECHEIYATLKANLKEIQSTLDEWCKSPLINMQTKPESIDDFQRRQKSVKQGKYLEVKEGGQHIHKLLKHSGEVLKGSCSALSWRSYIDFANDIVVEGLASLIRLSLQYVRERVDSTEKKKWEDAKDDAHQVYEKCGPVLEISLTLAKGQVIFKPSVVSTEDGKGVRDVVDEWTSSFLNIATIMKRLDTDGTFMREMHQDPEFQFLLASLTNSLAISEKACREFQDSYESLSYLWLSDMEKQFQLFVNDSWIEVKGEGDTPAAVQPKKGGAEEEGAPAAPEDEVVKVLDLKRFDEVICKYVSVQERINAMASPTDVAWLRVNSQPIKQEMSKWCSKWICQYTNHLHDEVVNKLGQLNVFIAQIKAGLGQDIANANDEGPLYSVMTHIRDVRKKEKSVPSSFPWLHETLALLKTHNVDMSDALVGGGIDPAEGAEGEEGSAAATAAAGQGVPVGKYLEDVPLQWDKLVKSTFKRKEEILPMQTKKTRVIQEEIEHFFLEMRKFRTKFREDAPFKFTGKPEGAYGMMSDWAAQLNDKVASAAKLNELEELFELQVSQYKETEDTRHELRQLKALWDFKDNVLNTFSSWKTQLWKDIDTEALEDSTKDFLKEIRKRGQDNPIVKGWQVYRDIEDNIKNMGVVLPLVNALHSPSMRDRHWKTLASICDIDSINPDDPAFCLANMLDLQLHEQVDNVEEIVETANKELKIEKKLTEITKVWNTLFLDFVPHKESDIFLIRPSEEVIENLETNQLDLQTIVGMGKFVDYFRDKVVHWQKTLGDVESVIKEWSHVSKMWTSLESIFLASADIRAQLPDDTKRFEGIDSEFKDMMKAAVNIPNVVDCCLADDREMLLRDMSKRLELCQKSLNEYLDVKKKIFPRFYFVSNVALLEILSNGNNPPRIMPFIGDCYDSLNCLTQPQDDPAYADDERWKKVGLEMIAKDGERIMLPDEFEMVGAVEDWLNSLTEAMMNCLRLQLDAAVEQAVNWAVEKPRHLWLFDFPAQVVLCGTMIYWTEEAEVALEELEGGQEDSVKTYHQLTIDRLAHLIQLVLGKLSGSDRCKIISLITLDVHGRDVVKKLVDEKAENSSAFLWQQQLRLYWQQDLRDVNIKITDYRCKYFYEWIGNTGRLVITPLTDRCYITLTMALRLFLGGAPAGPAGTGKTETTKDLARSLAIPCYVFNCSDQMNFETLGDIFRGLCQSGAWGCFDEFNRISIEVLSVVATQVKTIQDAIVLYSVPANREEEYQHLAAGTPPVKLGTFEFMSDIIALIPTCGFWITMNPGYAGRTELPENLKALFRSCAMIRPDLRPICENMLMSEGFLTAAGLAIKFVTLYQLSSELLSKQPHYDWGLRAVKSVLRVAGTLKRISPDMGEDKVLMRALRDFNTPKIPAHDTPIFLRLINDLFMGIEVSPNVNEVLNSQTVRAAIEKNLQPDDSFVLKVAQFQELLDVRHSVMLLGPAGCAKTTIWKTLQACHNLKEDWADSDPGMCWKPKSTCVCETVEPKSVITDELYGYMTLAKDWKDGCLSIIMRGMAKNFPEQGFHQYQSYKWVVLDGDIDALWIESMNTVMDDNKVLTLVSNERIPLSAAMRMVFEINSLKNASPATVSRAGILFINEADVGWKPFVLSWAAKREDEIERTTIPALFDTYLDATVELVRKGFYTVTAIRKISQVMSICTVLESQLPKLTAAQKTAELIEIYFVYALTWAFGGPMVVDKQHNCRRDFHNVFTGAFPNVKYPKEGLCFDYFWDLETGDWKAWFDVVPDYVAEPIGNGHGETSFQSLMVQTSDTMRLNLLLDLITSRGKGVMLVGGAGTGKTAIIQNYFHTLQEGRTSKTISMNYYTDSANLQEQIEAFIDKRSGRVFGPAGNKKLTVFIDDANLPYVEEYGTQNCMSLLRQHMDHGTIFDRIDLGFRKEIIDVQYVAAMNPTAGSFAICERNQRHFSTFSCLMPSHADLQTIYTSIIAGHLGQSGQKFPPKVQELGGKLALATIELHTEVSHKFLPSATKFVYNWNMREMTNIFQGLTLSTGVNYQTPGSLVKLWAHECDRVFSDRMINEDEKVKYNELMSNTVKKTFDGKEKEEAIAAVEDPCNIFTAFAIQVDGAFPYLPVTGMDQLSEVLEAKMLEYNESFAIMELVLFDQAMEHITRIARIIANPMGNAMLIGVGGSGKQSLTRLAAYIGGFEVKQLSVTSKFKVEDLKEALREFYKLAGVKGIPMVLLMTDSQIVNEKFLVYINNMLSSGWIPDLFEKGDMDGLFGGLRNEAKANGIADTPETMLEFFIQRVRTNLHIVLGFSPVGEIFRVRARRFPGLINSTAIDWFHAWPRQALVSVSTKFLAALDLGTEENKAHVCNHMAEVHLSVEEASRDYLTRMRRYNYVTPKSYLELISFYKMLLDEKRGQVQRNIDRLDVGLSTLMKTSQDVAELQVDLTHTMEQVDVKKAATAVLLEEMGVSRAAAEKQQQAANIEEEKAMSASAAAAKIEGEAETELSAAKPAMEAAAAAVDCLSKAMLTELKSLPKPPAGVDKVTTACLIMIDGEFKNHKWDRAKKMMSKVDAFKESLLNYQGESIPDKVIDKITPIIQDPEFTVECMQTKSAAAANLCSWVVNIYTYNRIYVKVKPLMDSLDVARASKAAALGTLALVQAEVAEVEAQLAELEETFKKATDEKAKVEAMAAACLDRLALAERLIGGLASENERWGREIVHLKEGYETLVGDVMLASAFTSYIGAFDPSYRNMLWREKWMDDLTTRQIPLTEGVDPLEMLTTGAKNAQMNAEGLPSDRISMESGAIIITCKRWPLIIDPQLQGIKWLREKEKDNNLVVLQLTQNRWLNKVEGALTNGFTMIIENLQEDIDATIDPVLSRAVFRRGRSLFLKLGGEEVEYDPKFQLYLQTKLANPHYKPEIAAQCTLINFIATESGLEDQLLARVVKEEQPALEQQKQDIVAAFQQYQIRLTQLEDQLLERLANAPDDILSDIPLIEGLEDTKKASKEINAAVELGKKTEVAINAAREGYRPTASEGAMLYFILTQMNSINHMYQYSLDSFVFFFYKALREAEAAEVSALDNFIE